MEPDQRVVDRDRVDRVEDPRVEALGDHGNDGSGAVRFVNVNLAGSGFKLVESDPGGDDVRSEIVNVAK